MNIVTTSVGLKKRAGYAWWSCQALLPRRPAGAYSLKLNAGQAMETVLEPPPPSEMK
jgi:hypothetical protein